MQRDRLKQMRSLILEIEEEEERRYKCGAYSLLRELAAWIDSIPDSQTRRAFRLRYVDGLSWLAVSMRLGYTCEDGARKMIMRYLEKNGN